MPQQALPLQQLTVNMLVSAYEVRRVPDEDLTPAFHDTQRPERAGKHIEARASQTMRKRLKRTTCSFPLSSEVTSLKLTNSYIQILGLPHDSQKPATQTHQQNSCYQITPTNHQKQARTIKKAKQTPQTPPLKTKDPTRLNQQNPPKHH